MNFQNRLKYYREKAGYTSAKEFAKFLGIGYTTYVGYENKGREPRYELLCKIANVLNVSLDNLVGRTPEDENERLRRRLIKSLKSFEGKPSAWLVPVKKKNGELDLNEQGFKFALYCAAKPEKPAWVGHISKYDVVLDISAADGIASEIKQKASIEAEQVLNESVYHALMKKAVSTANEVIDKKIQNGHVWKDDDITVILKALKLIQDSREQQTKQVSQTRNTGGLMRGTLDGLLKKQNDK